MYELEQEIRNLKVEVYDYRKENEKLKKENSRLKKKSGGGSFLCFACKPKKTNERESERD